MDLLERDTEVETVARLLPAAREGQGQVVLFQGPAGIGKTSLLTVAAAAAADAGFLVLRARGADFERGFPYGVVRQVFEPHLRRVAPAERARLFGGMAKLAEPVFAGDADAQPLLDPRDAAFAVAHGLYWLTAALADARPLMLAVDDVQWADPASLRVLTHLVRRLDGMPVLVALCLRTGEPGVDAPPLSDLIVEATQVVRPGPLTEAGVARFVAAQLAQPLDPAFAAACHRVTGGTPFLLVELVGALAERGVRPTAAAVSAVEEAGPQAVAAEILRRVRRLGTAATAVATATAVLGPDAQLHRAAALAELPTDDAARAVDALVEMSVLRPGTPLEFVHPIVHEAVYADLAPAARASAHRRAADLLATEHAESDAIAAHLLVTDPAARPSTVERLQEAAEHAAARGAPETAVAYLRRALDEGGTAPTQRGLLLAQLGRTETLIAPAAAIEHLRAAHALTAAPLDRAHIAREQIQALLYSGEMSQALELATATLEEVRGRDDDIELRLEALRAMQEFFEIERLPSLLSRLPHLERLAATEAPAGQAMMAVVAAIKAWLAAPPDEVRALLDRALAGGRLIAGEHQDSAVLQFALQALGLIDELDAAMELIDALLADARRSGSILGFAIGFSHRAWISARAGDLRSAEADLRAATKIVREHQVRLAEFGYLWYFIDAIVERPELDDEARIVLALDANEELRRAVVLPLVLETRGRIRLAHGQVAAAIEDLARCGETPYAHGTPNGWGWRPALATALATRDNERALELARAHLSAARHAQLPRAIGVALRTLGVVRGGEEGAALLEEAVAALETAPAPLEHARALVDLGAARRRAGHRKAARDPLRQGLHLAHACGATRLEHRAHAELVASGARPRRAVLTGRDALTATEERVARMAAGGMSNPEIAQALFVTRKTVENHLARIYSKLDINSRGALHDALGDDASAAR